MAAMLWWLIVGGTMFGLLAAIIACLETYERAERRRLERETERAYREAVDAHLGDMYVESIRREIPHDLRGAA